MVKEKEGLLLLESMLASVARNFSESDLLLIYDKAISLKDYVKYDDYFFMILNSLKNEIMYRYS